MRSKWFDYAEPFRTTYPQGDQGVYGTYTLVPGGPTTANLLEPSRTASVQRKHCVEVCRGLSHEFGVVRLYRTTSPQGDQGVCIVPMHLFRVV